MKDVMDWLPKKESDDEEESEKPPGMGGGMMGEPDPRELLKKAGAQDVDALYKAIEIIAKKCMSSSSE